MPIDVGQRASASVRRRVVLVFGFVAAMSASSATGQSGPQLAPLPIAPSLNLLPFRVDNTPPMAITPNGCVALFDPDEHQVVCTNIQTGATMRFGRDGEGPGEFRSIFAILATTDSRLLALSSSRITMVSPDGRLLKTVHLERELGQIARIVKDSVFGLGIAYDTVFAVSLATGGATALFGQPRADTAVFRGPLPYERGYWLVPNGARDWFVAPAWNYVILSEDSKGHVRSRMQRSVPPELPTKSDLAETRRVMERGNPGANLDGFMARAAKTAKPFIVTAPAPDASGRLWVTTSRIRDDSTELDVFSPSGIFVKTVRIAGRVTKIVINRDELFALVTQLSGSAAGDIGIRRYRISR